MRLSDNNANIKAGKVVTTPTAPAKITSATMRCNKGAVKFVLGLPTDSLFSSYAIFGSDNSSTSQPSFPGGSPLLRDKTSKPEDDSAIVNVRRHYWVVTMDRNNYPNDPVEANSYYVGSIVPTNNTTFLGATQ